MIYCQTCGETEHCVCELPFVAHSETSRDAAASLPNAGTLRALIYWYLVADAGTGNGHTDEELQADLAMPPSTQRPRRVELVKAGLVRDSGRVRKTRSGRNAVVWEAV